MSMRQLHEADAFDITVTDKNGRRQGTLVGRYGDWYWVLWNELEAPTTEHIGELWICEKGDSLFDRVTDYAHALCSPAMAVVA